MSQFQMADFPASWTTARIGDLAEIQYGKSLRSDERSGTGDVPVFGSGGQVGSHDRALHPGPSIVIGRKGTVGAVYYTPGPFWCIDTAFYLENISPAVDIEFLAHMLRVIDLSRLVITVGVPGISRKDIEPQRIPLPPLPEQQRIVAILRKTDELRRLRRQANARASDLLPSVFHEMFGDPINNSKNWRTAKLSQMGELDRGRSKHRPRDAAHLYGGPYPFVQTGDVSNSGGWITNYSQTYSEEGLAQSRIWPKGTLCITIAANIAQTGILTFDACFPDSVVGFIADSDVTAEYVQYCIMRHQESLETSAPQLAQKNINLGILRELVLPKPPHELQVRFAQLVGYAHQQSVLTEHSAQVIEKLFQSIVARTFIGELTATWRSVNKSELDAAAIERDRLLGIAQRARRAEITTTPSSTDDQPTTEAASARSADVYPVRQALLRSLSAVQDAVFRTLLGAARYMTVDALAERAGISRKQVAHTIDLLMCTGLVQAVSVPTDPTGDQTVYVRAYRPVRDGDDVRTQDTINLEALAA